jgi:hypothetical protein
VQLRGRRGEPLLAERDGGGERRRALRVGGGEDLGQRGADRPHASARDRGVVAAVLELDGDIDDAAGVDDEVGRPHDLARGQQAGDGVGRELVVGGAGDRAAAQMGHDRLVELAAERAQREHVDVGRQRFARRRPERTELLREYALGGVDVGEDESGAGSCTALRDA